jgi:hypothetical protein
MSEPDYFKDAIEAYRRCVADTSFVRSEWVAAGRPVMQASANGIADVHPLLKAVHECEAIANRLRGELELTPRTANRRGPDRASGAASAPDRVSRVRLKSLGSPQYDRDRDHVAGPPDERLSAGRGEQVEP